MLMHWGDIQNVMFPKTREFRPWTNINGIMTFNSEKSGTIVFFSSFYKLILGLRVRFGIFSIFNRLRICNRKKYMSNFYWSLLKTYMTTR